MNENLLLPFYLLETPDHMVRTLDSYWQQDARWLEQTHDYIQWMFPLVVRSNYNPHAPVLTDQVRQAFELTDQHESKVLQDNLSRSTQCMLGFYGYDVVAGDINRACDWQEKSRKWLNNGNHNHLRITRILRSLNLLGQGDLAQALLAEFENSIEQTSAPVPRETRLLWKNAAAPNVASSLN
ncbi:MAG: hypothetical protein H7A51_04335 [Akkermansiaceae bacterium]|nr:hypothetical protein [Akkermansiaceae bacterium]